MSTAPLRLALVGLGNVGTGVAQVLMHQTDRICHRSGRTIQLQRVVVRDLAKPRELSLPRELLTDDWQAAVHDPNVDVVVELMGGIHPAREVVLAALAAGKDVVTANKALLCQCGDEIFAAARQSGRTVAFEAAVAGGVPIIAAVGQSLAGNQIQTIQAILNGTSNYILSQMLLEHQSYGDALGQAQQLGFAEADPTLDVDGTDAAQKLTLLVQLAFGTRVPVSQFHVSGIDCLDQKDIQYASSLGYTIKLLAQAKLVQQRLELSVRPTLVRQDRPIAQTHGPFNAILLEGDVVGPVWFSGRGAGQLPTASAVLADIIDLAIGRSQLTFRQFDLWGARPAFEVAPPSELTSRFYLRLSVEDRPHVMADVTHILGRHGISLASVIQPESPEVSGSDAVPIVPLIIMTHRTSVGALQAADAELEALASIKTPRVCLAVAG